MLANVTEVSSPSPSYSSDGNRVLILRSNSLIGLASLSSLALSSLLDFYWISFSICSAGILFSNVIPNDFSDEWMLASDYETASPSSEKSGSSDYT